MAVFRYNNIELQMVVVKQFSHEVVHDDSGSDFLYMKHVLEVEGRLNAHATSYLPAGDDGMPQQQDGQLPAVTEKAIRHALSEPRKPLFFSTGPNQDLLVSPALGRQRDAKDGPIPEVIAVSEMVGTGLFAIRVRVVTWLAECPADPPKPFVSCRWEQSHDIDKDFYTTITTSGVAYFRHDLIETAQINGYADFLRSQLIPPMPLWFRRESMWFAVSPIGDKIAFRVVDRRMPYSLGGPASEAGRRGVTTFESVYRQGTVQQTRGPAGITVATAGVIASLDVTVDGRPDSLHFDLITWGLTYAIQRMDLNNVPGKKGTIRNVQVIEYGHLKKVTIHFEVYYEPPDQASAFASLRWEYLGIDTVALFTNDGKNSQPPDNVRGVYRGVLFAQALQDACKQVKIPQAGGNFGGPDVGGDTYLDVEPIDIRTGIANNLPKQQNLWSIEQTTKGPFLDCYTEDHRTRQEFVVVGPVTGPDGSPPEIMYLASPVVTRKVRHTNERLNGKPILPAPVLQGDTWESLKLRATVVSPTPAEDGRALSYRAESEYEYVSMDGTGGPGDPIDMNVLPSTNIPYDSNNQLNDYRTGIIEPPGTGPAGSGGNPPPRP
jgi:hypothetical protein